MKHRIYAGMLVGLLAVTMLTGCGSSLKRETDTTERHASKEATTEAEEIDVTKAVCMNGVMIGNEEEDEVISFLGVPYAKAADGKRRWKAPKRPKDKDTEYICKEFGNTAIQYEWPTEPASYTKKGEDCLTLNVWTAAERSEKPKKVMVFFHGGGYSWGGTADPMYNGHNFVKDHPDTILVTCNYRLGIMGWADFSDIPGGAEYTDINLGLRDQIRALEWLKENISAFGGDPDNVTIFGESAGAFCVGGLLYSPKANGLFKKAILQSGVFLPKDREEAKAFAKRIMEASSCNSMEELLAMSGEDWMKLDAKEWISDDVCGIVCDGDIIPTSEEKRDEALDDKIKDGVTILLGTNADEWNYFKEDAEGDSQKKKFKNWAESLDQFWDNAYEKADQKGKDFMNRFYERHEEVVPDELGKDEAVKVALVKSAFVTESWRMDHIRFADKYSDMGGEVYMYYWNVPSTKEEYYKSACHAVELAYIFDNYDDDIYAGQIDRATAVKAQNAWVSFADDGKPSTDAVRWSPYNNKTRETMMIERDQWYMESDPTGQYRDGLEYIGASVPW